MRSNLIFEVTTRTDISTVNTGRTDRELNGASEAFLLRAWIGAHLKRAVLCLHKLDRGTIVTRPPRIKHKPAYRHPDCAVARRWSHLTLRIPGNVRATSALWGKAFNYDWKKLYLFAWTSSSASSWTCIWLGCWGPMPWCSDFGELVLLDSELLLECTRNAPGISAASYSASHSSNKLSITI